MSEVHCANPRCRRVIPAINLEFGGPHIYLDLGGPVVCGPACQKGYHEAMTRAFSPGGPLSSDEACSTYLMGERDEV